VLAGDLFGGAAREVLAVGADDGELDVDRLPDGPLGLGGLVRGLPAEDGEARAQADDDDEEQHHALAQRAAPLRRAACLSAVGAGPLGPRALGGLGYGLRGRHDLLLFVFVLFLVFILVPRRVLGGLGGARGRARGFLHLIGVLGLGASGIRRLVLLALGGLVLLVLVAVNSCHGASDNTRDRIKLKPSRAEAAVVEALSGRLRRP
jgi:hypothetical protein